jgi:[NiFe] hydrogenase large subunit/hydrogenase large subunit
MASAINLDEDATINSARLADVAGMIKRAQAFVEQVYWPDLVAIAGYYKDWAAIGGGVGNFLAVGEFPETDIRDLNSLYFPRGIIMNKDLTKVLPYDHTKVGENVHSAWYEYAGGDVALHPYEGETKPKYTGPAAPWTYLQDETKYTWMKTPRYEGRPMQVGPLSRMLVAYASGHQDVKELVGEALGKLQVGPEVLFSTLGRTAARGIETVLLARKMEQWMGELNGRIKNGDTATFTKNRWEPGSWPAKSEGYGYLDAPRGALGHWVQIADGKIARYQCVVPSTWNCSPRDAQGQMSAYEAALIGTPVAKAEQPLEVLRTIHSFDPCIACAVHLHDETGRYVHQVRAF